MLGSSEEGGRDFLCCAADSTTQSHLFAVSHFHSYQFLLLYFSFVLSECFILVEKGERNQRFDRAQAKRRCALTSKIVVSGVSGQGFLS